jgi:hypothetical protein
MRIRLASTILALSFGVGGAPASAKAWDSFGHMAVAYVAYQQMMPATRSRALQLLAHNPKYAEWRNGLPPDTPGDEKDLMVFMIASTWPDQIKRDPTYTADGARNGNRPEGSPDPIRNTGYDDKLMHKYWHFVDTPFSRDGTALPSIPRPNVQTRIAAFRHVLATSSDDDLKSYDLSWLLHLVGDVHQPLHCATRVSRTERGGDDGGNTEEVRTCKACAPETLHAFWDDVLGTSEDPQTVIAFAKTLPAADVATARILDETVWVAESFQDAEQHSYVGPIKAGDGPFTLTRKYEANARRLAEKRVALAGARLANVLNAELK